MDFVAAYLGMPPIAVYEVATFYDMYNLKPVGKYKLTHLHQPAVRAARARAEAAEHLKQKLGIGFGETTADGCSRSRKASASAPAATRRCCWSTTSACAAA